MEVSRGLLPRSLPLKTSTAFAELRTSAAFIPENVSVDPKGLFCGKHQQLSPLRKPVVSTATTDLAVFTRVCQPPEGLPAPVVRLLSWPRQNHPKRLEVPAPAAGQVSQQPAAQIFKYPDWRDYVTSLHRHAHAHSQHLPLYKSAYSQPHRHLSTRIWRESVGGLHHHALAQD